MEENSAPVEIDETELLREADSDLSGVATAAEGPADAAVDQPEGEEEDSPEAVAPSAQSNRVGFYWVNCSGGVWSSFSVPKQAFPYTVRFVFVNAVGARTYSGFGYWNRSEYPPTRIWGNYLHAIPRGTRQIYAYWWCGTPQDRDPGSPYWNYINRSC